MDGLPRDLPDFSLFDRDRRRIPGASSRGRSDLTLHEPAERRQIGIFGLAGFFNLLKMHVESRFGLIFNLKVREKERGNVVSHLTPIFRKTLKGTHFPPHVRLSTSHFSLLISFQAPTFSLSLTSL